MSEELDLVQPKDVYVLLYKYAGIELVMPNDMIEKFQYFFRSFVKQGGIRNYNLLKRENNTSVVMYSMTNKTLYVNTINSFFDGKYVVPEALKPWFLFYETEENIDNRFLQDEFEGTRYSSSAYILRRTLKQKAQGDKQWNSRLKIY